MPNWEIPSFDSESLEEGKFYSLYVNKDNATLTVSKDVQDSLNAKVLLNEHNITAIELTNTDQGISIQNIINNATNDKEIILDNTARINNLEDEDLRTKFLIAMEMASIKKTFTNQTDIEIQYGRKEIISISVNVLISQNEDVLLYDDATNTVKIQKELTLNSEGVQIIKKVKIHSNSPISGYVLLL